MSFDIKGHELFVSQMQDRIRTCIRGYKEVTTSFLTVPEQSILSQMVPSSVQVSFFGGFAEAERKIACLSNEDQFVFPIVCLESRVDLRFKTLTHKDVLGSLMNLGIERETLGDLIVDENRILIFCLNSLKDFICDNCTRIGSCTVSFHVTDVIPQIEKQTEEILVYVPSLRLDAVVSSLAHVSRKDATLFIKRGYVKLNDVVLEQNKQLCNNDFVSIRKVGRFYFKGICSTTKKNRLILQFDKYI